MRSRNFSVGLVAVVIVALAVFGTGTRAVAQTETILSAFSVAGSNPNTLEAGLIFDAAGSLYGTTSYSGGNLGGAVFELTPIAGGGWSESILYTFNNGTDGHGSAAALTFDKSGNLYGTTAYGGTGTNCTVYGCGTVFKLTYTGGAWTEQILHNFSGDGTDGYQPSSNLIFDAAGNLYGTTSSGGASGGGTVFEMKPTASGGWVEKVLHNFTGSGRGGATPLAGLIFDASGNLYGTTANGGAHGYFNAGTVFELTPTAKGEKWTEIPLHQFGKGSDGRDPSAGLTFDASGNLYGTTFEGGTAGRGIVFELMPKPGGWSERILHNFALTAQDGYNPTASLLLDARGNLYGTTRLGGTNSTGIAFELTPDPLGGWAETILHNFSYLDPADGQYPSGLIFDGSGNLYGTTQAGGINYGGVVFEIKP